MSKEHNGFCYDCQFERKIVHQKTLGQYFCTFCLGYEVRIFEPENTRPENLQDHTIKETEQGITDLLRKWGMI